MSSAVSFDPSRVEYVLEAFDKRVNEEGYIVESETGDLVTAYGEDKPIKAEELAIIGGTGDELVFVPEDLDLLIEFTETTVEEQTPGMF